MGSITGPYVTPARASDLNQSAFDERIHQPKDTSSYRLTAAWQHKLQSFRVDPKVSEDALKQAVTKDLGKNNLDELAIRASDGLHVVYGRGIAADINVGDTFVSSEVKGSIIAIDREVSRDLLIMRIKDALRMTVAVAAPFVVGIPAASYVSTLTAMGPLLGLGVLALTMVAGMAYAITGVSANIEFGEASKRFAADKSRYAGLAAERGELIAAPQTTPATSTPPAAPATTPAAS